MALPPQPPIAALAVALVLASGCVPAPAPAPAPARIELVDLEGRAVAPLAVSDGALTVLLFTRADCPISNRYAPEIERLKATYSARGVAFWMIYVDPDETAQTIRDHQNAFGTSLDALRDPEHRLVRFAGATVTPEAAVYVGPERLVYRGRIDDRYTALGEARPEATRHDLAEALDAWVAGRGSAPATTNAVGCFIADLE